MADLFKKIFAPRDSVLYPPSGMFTLSHFIALIVTITFLAVALYIFRNIKKENIKKMCKVLAISLTILETIKIAYNLYYGYTALDHWFPLSYCSIFIYSLYFSLSKNKTLEKLGYCFISGGGILAGSFFLIFPTTSLMLHPIYHYLCIYSMLFHAMMFFTSVLVISKKVAVPNIKNFKYYLIYLTIFSIIAITMNIAFESNMMFYGMPYNMPIKFVVDIYNFSNVLYIIVVFLAYAALYPFMALCCYLINKYLSKGENKNVI